MRVHDIHTFGDGPLQTQSEVGFMLCPVGVEIGDLRVTPEGHRPPSRRIVGAPHVIGVFRTAHGHVDTKTLKLEGQSGYDPLDGAMFHRPGHREVDC